VEFFFSNPSAIYTKWCAQTFPPILGLFTIFDRNFANIVAPSSDEYENYVVHLKEQSPVKKMLKTASKSGNKGRRNACSNYAPLECTVLRTRSVTNKQTNKKLETKASPPRQCSTGRMSGHSTKKDVNYYVNNYHA